MSLINSINLIILLENKISTINTVEKKTMIQCKKWTLTNVMKIYLYNIPKISQWSYLLIK